MFDVLAAGDSAWEPVLLLHGFPQTAACWTELAEVLAGAGYRVLAPDQRGYSSGVRPRAVRDYRMPGLVADALALADRAGAGRFRLVGHDWGGAVAWHLAARHPERVATLTAVSTPHPRAFTAALRSSAQPLRSAYIAFSAHSACPSWPWGPHGLAGLRLLLAGSGLGPGWIEAYTGALAGRERWPRRWRVPGGRPVHPAGPGGDGPHPPPVGIGRPEPGPAGHGGHRPLGYRPLPPPCPGLDAVVIAGGCGRRAAATRLAGYRRTVLGDPKGLPTTVLTYRMVEGQLTPGPLAGPAG